MPFPLPRSFPAMKPSLRFLSVPLHSPLFPLKIADILALSAKPLNLLVPAKCTCQAHNLKVVGSNPTPATKQKQRLSPNRLGLFLCVPRNSPAKYASFWH